MIIFIIVNVLIVALIVGGVRDYHRLKQYLPKDAKKDFRASFRIIDVLFNAEIRDQPQARKIQKRAIWQLCAALALVHVSKEIYRQQIR